MALATRCPHCHTTFRVASDQLKLRGGMVRCGACQQVFNGSAHLTELPARPAAAPASQAPPSAPDGQVDFDDVPVYTLDFGSTFDPLGILPKAAPAAPEATPPAAEATPAATPDADTPAAAALPDAPLDPSPPHGDVLADAVAATATANTNTADIPAPPAVDADAPAEAAQDLPPDTSPPHGDVLAHAVDALAPAAAAPAVSDTLAGVLPDAPLDPSPPHGDVLADAVAATTTDNPERLAAGAGTLAEAEQDLRPDATAPHGDVLAAAVDALAPAGAEIPGHAPLPDAPPDPSPPHGDILAAAPHPVAPADDDSPMADSAAEAPWDPSAPHGDELARAVEAASDGAAVQPAPDFTPAAPLRVPSPLSFIPQGRVEPRLEPDAAPGAPARPDPDPAPPPPQPLPDWTEPEPLPTPPAPARTAPGRIEPSFNLPVDEELVAQPLRDDASRPEPAHAMPAEPAPQDLPDVRAPDGMMAGLPLRASAAGDSVEPPMAPGPASRSARAKAVDARTRRSRLTPTRIEAPKLRVPESDEPEFVKRSRRQEQSGRSRRILMAVGAVVLLLVLAAQLVLNFRDVLAARHPGLRPALGATCALLGCRVELPAQIDNLAIETGELTTLGPDTYSLNTLLRNQGSLVQAWPSIELELTDAADKPVLRRVFAPADYLPQGASSAAGFGARSEQAVRLHFALTELKPSGYHIAVFYP